MITIEELNELLKVAINRKSCGLENLPMELWKFGGNELKIHLLGLFNNIIDKNQMPQEWEEVYTNNNRKLVNTILYADDLILMATSEDDLQTIAQHLNLIPRKYKMTISSTKTK